MPVARRLRVALWGLCSLPLLLADAAAWAQAACERPVARLASAEGPVALERPGAAVRLVALDDALCPGDVVQVGPRGRAALALADGGVLRLDQNTTLHVGEAGAATPSLLGLLTGALHFLSRTRRALEINTPFVNAGVEGTEFLLRVLPDRALLAVYEGRVRFENPLGRVVVAGGQGAEAAAGRAPVLLTAVVRPRDAVRWALYYPPVLTPLAAPGAAPGALPPALAGAAAAAGRGDRTAAFESLERVPEAERDAAFHALRAGLLLSVGRADEARADIERALMLQPDTTDALALRSVIAVVQDDRERALADARRALELEPDSAAAALALSYALQARFELDEAREVLGVAVEQHPEDPLLRARLAELWLMLGHVGRAHEEAKAAVALAPELSRAQMVLGFVELARIDIDAAKDAFARALEREPDAPLPRLGLGLALIRAGELGAGRRAIEIAAGLDPGDALLRSYLGKAYFEEHNDAAAAEAFATAKVLDPLDPTPFFYDAIRKQATNRPVEALRDLETSIRLNDNRAVYRSRLLLDEDLAARGARLGRIYNDLGFEQLALVEGWKSVAREPANHAAHRLLADTYSALPLHEIAQDSELLQAQLLQPLNINPVQPRLASNQLSFLNDTGPGDVAFNEFTRLFTVEDPLTLDLEGIVGTQDTLAYNAVASGIYDRFSYSAGHFRFETDGFRSNNDLRQDISGAFAQAALSPSTSLLGEFRLTDQEEGDRALRFDPTSFFGSLREESDTKTARIGIRHDFSPASTTLATYAYRELDGELDIGEVGFLGLEEEKIHLGELRHLYRSGLFNVDIGGGYLKGDREGTFFFGGQPPFRQDTDLEHGNIYSYGHLNYPRDVQLTLGLSAEKVDDGTVDRSQLNPKIGLIWNVNPNTLLRAAALRTVKRNVISSQTIEPTNVAGFNQFFDGINGTDAWRYGIGLDYKFSNNLFVGAELSYRKLDVPSLIPGTPPRTVEFDTEETFGRMYFYWMPLDTVAVSAEYRFDRLASDVGTPDVSMRALSRSTTHRFPLEVRWFHPSGLLAWARGTYVDQEVRFQHVVTGAPGAGSDDFWAFDAGIGFRLPNQYGLALVEARNLFDANFRFQDVDPEDPSILPERTILARLIVRF